MLTSEDPLCRPLTPSEQQWLAQSSLIALAGIISTETAAAYDLARLRSAVQRVAETQPFLQVRIDNEKLSYSRNDGVPVTGENLGGGSGGGDGSGEDLRIALRAAAARQLAVGIDRGVCLARAHLVDIDGAVGQKMLIVVADHLCFDGRSLMVLFESICDGVVANAAGTADDDDESTPMLDFIEVNLFSLSLFRLNTPHSFYLIY